MSSASSPVRCSQENQQPCTIALNGFADHADASSRKRKYDEASSQSTHELGPGFTIEVRSSGHPSKPIKLLPKLLTSRSCLPLSYLDLSGADHGIVGTQIFGARIASLEANLQGNPYDQPLLIGVSGAQNGRLFAIERVDVKLYALCRLGKCVTLEALEKLRISSQIKPPPTKQRCVHQGNGGESDWWRSAAVGGAHTDRVGRDKKAESLKEIPVQPKKGVRKPPSVPPAISNEQRPAAVIPQELETIAPTNGNGKESLQTTLPHPAEILATIRAQYQEALYLSRSSLAYFAKGPLSRARAAFSSSGKVVESASMLIQYLRSSILTLTVMDKKYKDTLPGMITALPAGTVSEDDIGPVVASLVKKDRKSKRDKIGKDGLYSGEEANIAKWWLSRHIADSDSESTYTGEEALTALLSEQRARETQLQIILILETVALEISSPSTNSPAHMADEADDNGANNKSKKKKTKKPIDLTTFLDILVDRLSIWQSMRLEDSNHSATGDHKNMPQAKMSEHADYLKSFCVDVVLPFYGTRLPEVTKMLCQKLGGPKAPSPVRPSLAKAASASRLAQKLGAPIQAPPQKKPRRTLERVLTEEKTLRSRAPSLSRSATDSALPGLKREVSDTALSTIPLNRLALQKSQRYTQREVDLKAASHAAEAKLRKKANVQRELQGAIAALKKPNPRLAVKELVEAAEKRTAGSNSRKPKNPIRSLFAQGVQVTATPKGHRQKDVFEGLPRLPATTVTAATEPDEIPPSSVSRVPSSVQRHPAPQAMDNEPRLPRPYSQTTIEQTPTRGPSKQSQNLLVPEPTNGPSSVFLTPSKPRRSLSSTSRPPPRLSLHATALDNPHHYELEHQEYEVQTTPQKPQEAIAQQSRLSDPSIRAVRPVAQKNALVPGFASSPPVIEEETSKSLFETLGWDDYVDELA